MSAHTWIVAAVALFTSPLAADAQTRSQGSQPSATQPQPLTLPQGATSMTLNEGEQIRDTLGAILNSIVTDDEFSDVVDFESMVDHLAEPDRRRIGNVGADRLRQLTASVQRLRQVWSQRYAGQPQLGDFDEDQVFRNAQLAEGRIANPATLAAHWPVTGRPAESVAKPVGTTGGFFEENRDIAVVRLETAGNQRPATVSLINERFDRWRVDIPDSVTTADLLGSLQRRFDAAAKASASWPADRDGAHRYLANEVLMALNGVTGSQ